MAELKQRKCKACKHPFMPARSTQVACGIDCAMQLAHEKKVKVAECDRLDTVRKDRARKERLKTRRDWEKEAQAAVNSWVRERDADRPCISCGRFHTGQWHAGHYLSTGARPELRYEPLNIWKQCAPCNVHLSGNAVLYRQALVREIGIERVEWLEGPHPVRKYTADDLKAIRDEYRKKMRGLVKERANV